MVKITAVFIIVYFVLMAFTKLYIYGLSPNDKALIAMRKYSKRQYRWFALLGIMGMLSIIFAAISGILLVVTYL